MSIHRAWLVKSRGRRHADSLRAVCGYEGAAASGAVGWGQTQDHSSRGPGFTPARHAHLTRPHRAIADRLEMLDEVEEWHLIMQHYCITVAVLDEVDGGSGLGSLSAIYDSLSKQLGHSNGD